MTLRFLFLAVPLALAGCATAPAPRSTPPVAAVQPFERGMVSAADPRAAEAGAAMLRAGGSATDAAVATMLALTVVEPQSSGIGGGGFFVTTDAAGHVSTIDGREKAPAAALPGRFLGPDGKPRRQPDLQPGGLSTGVPGSIALAAKAHAEHGRLRWAALFAPAIALARDGFAITPRLNASLRDNPGTAALSAGARAVFYDAAGVPLPVGTTVRNPALAAFLGRVAKEGPGAFYKGENAAAIARAVSTAPVNPTPMTAADVAAYEAKDRAPVCGQYRAYRVCGMGPPSSGATTVYAVLKQLERFDLTAMGKDSPAAWHLIADSMRLAYADRARYLGDADFVTVPVAGLTDPAYLAQRSALLDPARALGLVTAGTPPGAQALSRADAVPGIEKGTSHFVAVDRAGNAASYTSTIESGFGSVLFVNGYYLNNELTDFDAMPVVDGRPAANAVQAGKRPRSSMAPTLVFGPDGKLRIAIGAAGGTTIPAQVAKALIGVLDWDLTAQEAIALPGIFAPGDTVIVERGSALEAMLPALIAFGHKAESRAIGFKANAVEVVAGRLVGAADPRSEGRAVGE